MRSNFCRRSSSPCWKRVRIYFNLYFDYVKTLSESAGNVVFRLFIRRLGEDFFRLVEFDHLTQQEESGKLGDTRRLLHVMRDYHYRIPFFELKYQLFDFSGGDGIEGRARLIHE